MFRKTIFTLLVLALGLAAAACGGEPASTATPTQLPPTNTPQPTATSTPVPELAELTADTVTKLEALKTYDLDVIYRDLALSGDGKLLAQTSPNNAEEWLLLRSLETGETVFSLTKAEIVRTSPIAITADGKRLAYSFSDVEGRDASRDFRVYDLEAGSAVFEATVPDGGAQVASLAFSPDGSKLVVGTGVLSGKGVSLWDVASGERILIDSEMKVQEGFQSAFSPDGSVFVVASGTVPVPVIDAETGALVRSLASVEGKLRSIAVSANGTYVAGGTEEGKVYVWTLADGELVTTFEADNAQWITAVGFTVNSALVVSGDRGGMLRFWDIEKGLVHEVKLLNVGGIWSLAFTPDGKGLITMIGQSRVGMDPLPTTTLYGAYQ